MSRKKIEEMKKKAREILKHVEELERQRAERIGREVMKYEDNLDELSPDILKSIFEKF